MEIYENLDLQDLDGEIWKEIEGYDGDYFISNLGRVKSFKYGKEIILENIKTHSGYLQISLWKNKKQKTKKIHILMFENFIEEIPKGYVVHHIDFTKDNRLNNFQLMTESEHHILHNLINPPKGFLGKKHSEEWKKEQSEKMKGKYCGENNPNSTLKEKDVIEIRIDLKEGKLLQKEIAEKFGVYHTVISKIKNNKLWKHINI